MQPPKYRIFGDFILRTHVLPTSKALPLPEDLELFFRGLLNDNYFKEAIYLASPDLYIEATKWQSNELPVKETEKLMLTLLKYWLRMSARCTPFGIFAGSSVGSLSDKTSVVLSEKGEHRRSLRLDMNYLCELAQH